MLPIHCPKCQRILLDENDDGTQKLRTKLLLFHNNNALAMCPQCKTEVPVPVSLQPREPKLQHVIRKPLPSSR